MSETTRTTAEASGSSVIQVLTARNVSIPIQTLPPAPDLPDDLLKIRTEFLAGNDVSREDLTRLLRSSESGGGTTNGNCGIC